MLLALPGNSLIAMSDPDTDSDEELIISSDDDFIPLPDSDDEPEPSEFSITRYIPSYQQALITIENYWPQAILPKVQELYKDGQEEEAQNLLEACREDSSAEGKVFTPRKIIELATKLTNSEKQNESKFEQDKKNFITWLTNQAFGFVVTIVDPKIAWPKIFDAYKKNPEYASNKQAKAVQKELVKSDNRSIIQLRSLDQNNKAEIFIKNAGVACGYCSIYNAAFIKTNKLDQEPEQSLFLKKATSLGTATDFNTWAQDTMKALAHKHALMLEEKIKRVDLNTITYENVKKDIEDSYQVALPATRSEVTQKIIADAGNNIAHEMLFPDDVEFLKKHSTLATEKSMSLIQISDIANNNDFLQNRDLQSLSDSVGLQDFFEGSKRLHQTGEPHYVIFNTHAHWLTLIFTKDGMLIADSLNKPNRKDDFEIKLVYDLFFLAPLSTLNLPEPKKPASPLEIVLQKVQDSLTRLRDNLAGLKNKLELLKQKLAGT